MGLKSKATAQEVNTYFQRLRKRVDSAIVMRLSYIGEELVTYAKSIPPEQGYTDRTGNLRSSTGYIIVANGQIVKKAFSKKGTGEEGVSVGVQYAESLASNHSKGYVLIMVAGMEYALAVESRGKDVLTTTEYKAEKLLPIHLRKLKEQIKKMKI